MYRRRAARAVALGSVVAALSACGGGDDEPTSDDAARWDAVDPCTLADEATLDPLLRADVGNGTPVEADERRSCTWGRPETLNTVTVTTTDTAAPDKPLRIIEVLGKEGRALAESKYQCILEFTTDSGTLLIDTTFGLDAVADPDTSCNRSVPLAEHSLTVLHWA
ncbi:hypothetical protein L1080_023040 [Rhodococcus sp. MSC1_016]|jgi:hypothetical protein|uniref:hypothetical protein n=1 Tax=Rhodococcus sp. MSC1_016 TaxID=2909266 RepID=UPI00202FA6B6|nr:hypothetical protein [Rhodococcus sp. MSC1_016]